MAKDDHKEIPINKINLNRAGRTELAKVEGIGEDTAEQIMRYRQENGDFKNLEELRNINGMRQDRFESIRDKFSL